MKFRSEETFNTNGEHHSFGGKPAYVSEKYKMWRKNGILHRENGPAEIDYNYWWRLDGRGHYGIGVEPPEAYLKELERRGIKYVRGSDEI